MQDARHTAGLGWHHVLHARSCIERGKVWQAEYWISAVRDYTITLACLALSPIWCPHVRYIWRLWKA